MSIKGDKSRVTDIKAYRGSPLWQNLERKKMLDRFIEPVNSAEKVMENLGFEFPTLKDRR